MAFEGTPTQVIGNVGKDQPNRSAVHDFKTNSGKEGTTFSLAVQPDYNGPTEWIDVTSMNQGLRDAIKRDIYAGAKGIAVEGLMTEKQGNGDKVFKTLWANRIGVISWLDSKGTSSVNAPAADGEDDF